MDFALLKKEKSSFFLKPLPKFLAFVAHSLAQPCTEQNRKNEAGFFHSNSCLLYYSETVGTKVRNKRVKVKVKVKLSL
jgi:hypothetical protein